MRAHDHLLPEARPERRADRSSSLLLWAVVCGGLIAGASIGIRHVHGLFMLPITLDRGWTRESFSFALALQNLSWGLAQPLAGMLADRWGSGRVLGFGVLLYGAALAATAFAESTAALYLVCGVGIGIAQACTAFGAVYAALNRLAPAPRRGWALATAGAVGSAVQFAAVPLTQALLDSIGWQGALMTLGAIVAALLPASLLLRDRLAPFAAASMGTIDRGTAEAPAAVVGMRDAVGIRDAVALAFGHGGFRLLVLGFFACGFQLAFIANHLPAYLLDHGIGARVAVIGLGLIALANIPGTYICGRLGGPYRAKRVLALLHVLRALAMVAFVLLPKSPASVHAFCIAMGLLWLGTLPLTNGMVAQLFGVGHIGTLFGFVFLGHQLGAFCGVWLGGWLFDRSGSYDLMWGVAIGVGLLAAAAHMPIDDRPHPRFVASPA